MRRLLPPLTVAFGLLALAGCKEGASAHLDRARDFVFEKKPHDALTEYRLALDAIDKDDSARAQLFRARALRGAADVYYLELRDLGRAVEVYRELISRCPEAPETLEGRIHLADILRTRFHDLRGAIAELTAALGRNPPQSAELAYQVAKLYFELADYKQCELEAAKVAKRYETSAFADDALFLRGQALAMQDTRKVEAMGAFTDLVARFPDSDLQPHALFELGKLQAEANEGEKAIGSWVEALKRHPDPKVVQGQIALLRRRLRNTTPRRVGDESAAFDRDARAAAAKKPKVAKSSVEAAGGTADEAAREQGMSREPAGAPAPAH